MPDGEIGELVLQHGFDGSVALFGEAPARTSFTLALLERADRRLLVVEGDLITITLDDRVLAYRVVSQDPVTGVVEAELVPDEGAGHDV